MFAALIMTLSSCIPVLASPAPQLLHVSAYPDSWTMPLTSNIEARFEDGESGVPLEGEILYDCQFLTEDGKIYDVDGMESGQNANCDHTYKSGIYSEHSKKSDGGCVIRQYNARICTKCEDLIIEDLKMEVKYPVCPH